MIEAEVVGGRELIVRFEAMAPKVHFRVAKAVATVMTRLQAYVKAGKLSGQVLHVRTGALRRSIAHRFEDANDVVTGQIGVFGGPTEPYGRVHEFGFEGTVDVRAHFRTIKQAFGRPIAETSVLVSAHTRHMVVPEKSFLRSSLREFAGAITQVLDQAVREAVHA